MDEGIDRNGAMQDTYNAMKIGQRVEIDQLFEVVKGTIMDKYLESNDFGSELYIDVLTDTGNIIERYLCYAGFYPRYTLI